MKELRNQQLTQKKHPLLRFQIQIADFTNNSVIFRGFGFFLKIYDSPLQQESREILKFYDRTIHGDFSTFFFVLGFFYF